MRRHIWLLAMQTFIFLPKKSKLFIIRQGHVAWRSSFFSRNFETIGFIYHLTRVHRAGTSDSLSWSLQMFLCRVLWSNLSDFQFCSHWLCFLITSVCLTHPITLRLSPLAPSPRCLSLFRSTLGALNILASSHFLLPPRPSVRWENWPHKKWKGLFKRSSSVMKTYYCIPWCAARGGCCWPTAILFS